MKISIITLFPDMFTPVLETSMLKKASDLKKVTFELVNLRDFGLGPRHTVDDTPYGGGAGMVLKPEPIYAAVEKCKLTSPSATVVMMSPRGQKYTQALAKTMADSNDLIILCGHYEGFDERILDIVDAEISIGDYILTGGEIPAMVLVDSITRLLPGVLGDARSNQDESFSAGLLEYPHYTRPDDFEGKKVPDVLKSGDHAKIAQWRKAQALEKTQAARPDLTDF